jgi:hypothetical protein
MNKFKRATCPKLPIGSKVYISTSISDIMVDILEKARKNKQVDLFCG